MKQLRIWVMIGLIALVCFQVVGAAAQLGEIAIGDTVEVVTDGMPLRLRSEPSTGSTIVTRLPDGARLTVVGGPQSADGYVWWELESELGRGWAAARYLRVVQDRPAEDHPIESQSTEGNVAGTYCERPYAGIQYCERDDGQTHVVVIDLDDPHVRFETILANDTTSVNTNNREFVKDMAARSPYNGLAAVINADYFGAGHGPEGLTLKNGIRFDGIERGDMDQCAVYRSALAIGKAPLDGGSGAIPASIVHLEDDRQPLDMAQFFNVIGGGPQVVFDRVWRWERGLTNPQRNNCWSGSQNDIINGEYFSGSGAWDSPDKYWSAIGITRDQRMIWVIAPYPKVSTTFSSYPTEQAIKLDGGGSSQLWVAGKEKVASSDNREVAGALGVFYLHAAEVVDGRRWQLLVDGESAQVRLKVKNLGADTWYPGEVALRNIQGPYQSTTEFPLTTEVPPGKTISWEWITEPISLWGVKNSEWQLVHAGEGFPGSSIKIQFVVIPKNLEQKKQEIEQKVQEWIDQEAENLEQRVVDYVTQQTQSWFERLMSGGCTSPAIVAISLVGAVRLRRSKLRRRGWKGLAR